MLPDNPEALQYALFGLVGLQAMALLKEVVTWVMGRTVQKVDKIDAIDTMVAKMDAIAEDLKEVKDTSKSLAGIVANHNTELAVLNAFIKRYDSELELQRARVHDLANEVTGVKAKLEVALKKQ